MILSFVLLVSSSGCLPSVVKTEHEYLLIRREGDTLTILEDDDPLYARFDNEVLNDPYLYRLLMIYEHGTEAFLATNALTSLSQTIANRPMIVLSSDQVGVVRDVVAQYRGTRIAVELGLGLGDRGEVNLDLARRNFAWAIAPLWVELMGVKTDSGDSATQPWIYQVTTPSRAFWLGFAAALDAMYGQLHPEILRELEYDSSSPERRERLYRLKLVPANGLRFRFEGDTLTSELRSPEDVMRTPGVVATFFYRLLQNTGDFYTQKHMLWFANFESDETPYAKVLLAMYRMSGHKVATIQSFIESYIETFPAERDSVLLLAEQVFGGEALPD